MENLEVGEVVLCTVDKIVRTTVFVKIHISGTNGKYLEGSIVLSEIAPGRIRNLRDYVVPKKRIVCKILRISGDHMDLSLRRVTQKERKEVLEQEKQEKSCKSVLKGILGDKSNEIIENVLKNESVYSFCERIKENPKELEKFTGKENAKKVQDILKTQKSKSLIIKKDISLTTQDPNGIKIIKETLSKKDKEIEVSYISAGKYSLKTKSEDPKKADNKLKEFIEAIEKSAKEKSLDFSIREK